MTDISEWYKHVPIFTKYWLSLSVGFSIVAKFGILAPSHLILRPELIFSKLQIWRPMTALFFYPLNPSTGFHFLINCFFLYNYSRRLETDHFKQTPSDYLFLLIFNWLCCVIVGIIAGFPFLMDPMVLSVLYVWCQLNKDTIVNFWFGTQFKAMYLPWVLLGFNLILSNGEMFSVVGIVVGHLYFFLKFKYPQELGGGSYLNTPRFLKQYFPDVQGGVHGFGVAPVNQRNVQPQDVPVWGRGHVLGNT